MQINRIRHAGVILLILGASTGLLLRCYLFTQLSPEFSVSYMLAWVALGEPITKLIWPTTPLGSANPFRPIDILWLPWAGVVMMFLIVMGLAALRTRTPKNLPISTATIGAWFIVGEIVGKILYGFWYFERETKWLVFGGLSDLSIVVIGIGAGLWGWVTYKFTATKLTEAKMAEANFDNDRFRTLLGFGKFFSFLGWLIVLAGALLSFLGMGQFGQRGGMGGGLIPTAPALIILGVSLILFGFAMVASGQFLSCFVSLENNTYVTKLLQQNMIKFLRDKTLSPPQEAETTNQT